MTEALTLQNVVERYFYQMGKVVPDYENILRLTHYAQALLGGDAKGCRVNRLPLSFDEIQGLLKDHAQTGLIPEELAQLLGFKAPDKHWSLLYLDGQHGKKSGDMVMLAHTSPTPDAADYINSAVATIVVNGICGGENRVFPYNIKIGGIAADDQGNIRIVGISYAADTDSKGADWFGISLTQEELQSLPKAGNQIATALRPIPTPDIARHSFASPGLITRGMIELLGYNTSLASENNSVHGVSDRLDAENYGNGILRGDVIAMNPQHWVFIATDSTHHTANVRAPNGTAIVASLSVPRYLEGNIN